MSFIKSQIKINTIEIKQGIFFDLSTLNQTNKFNTLLKMDLKTGDPKIKICLLL